MSSLNFKTLESDTVTFDTLTSINNGYGRLTDTVIMQTMTRQKSLVDPSIVCIKHSVCMYVRLWGHLLVSCIWSVFGTAAALPCRLIALIALIDAGDLLYWNTGTLVGKHTGPVKQLADPMILRLPALNGWSIVNGTAADVDGLVIVDEGTRATVINLHASTHKNTTDSNKECET